MNILLINHYAGSPVHGMEYRPFYLAREWVKLGHQATIVAASCSHVRSIAPTLKGDFTTEMLDGVRYIWLKTPSYQGNGAPRAINIFSFVAQLFRHHKQLIEQIQPDVVINSSTYPLDIYPARWIARKANAKLIFEVHDLWPLSPIELGGMSPQHPFIRIMQKAENDAYRIADRVVSLLPKADEHMRSHGMAPDKFAYLPNGINLDEWKGQPAPLPQEHQDTIARLKQQGLFTIGYAGAHGIANALTSLLDAAEVLRDQPVAFVLVGQGPEKAELQKLAVERQLKNVFFLPPIGKKVIPTLLSELDCLFISLQNQSIFRFGISPNKLMDYMMAAKPIIQAIAAGNDPVAESQCGLSVAPENGAAIAAAVQQLMMLSPEERAVMGQNGQSYVTTHHDYAILAQKFIAVMSDSESPNLRTMQYSESV